MTMCATPNFKVKPKVNLIAIKSKTNGSPLDIPKSMQVPSKLSGEENFIIKEPTTNAEIINNTNTNPFFVNFINHVLSFLKI